MTLSTTNTDPFNDGSLVSATTCDSDNGKYIGTFIEASGGTYLDSTLGKARRIKEQHTLALSDIVYNQGTVSFWIYPRTTSDFIPVLQASGTGMYYKPTETITNIDSASFLSNTVSLQISLTTRRALLMYHKAGTDVAAQFAVLGDFVGWHHVCVTINNNVAEYFVDGVSLGTGVPSAYNYRITQTYGTNPSNQSPTDADIDQLMVFNRILTQSEIVQLYNMKEATPLEFNTVDCNEVFFDGAEVGEIIYNGTRTFLR